MSVLKGAATALRRRSAALFSTFTTELKAAADPPIYPEDLPVVNSQITWDGSIICSPLLTLDSVTK